jgi:ABC-2 type transport system permease protein
MINWLRSYGLMLRWQALNQRTILPLSLVVQIMVAVGFVIGVGFYYPQMNPTLAKLLTTGGPTIILLMVGVVLVPQMVAGARKEGTFDYVWSLPVPRMVYVAADTTIYFLTTLPGVLLAIAIGAAYYHFGLHISLLVIPGFILTAVTGTLLGYALAMGVSKPEVAQILTQVFVFVIMIFSPVIYPLDQLPGWLQGVQRALPILYMADLTRGTLTDLPAHVGLDFAVVGAWCFGALMLTYLLVRRRR